MNGEGRAAGRWPERAFNGRGVASGYRVSCARTRDLDLRLGFTLNDLREAESRAKPHEIRVFPYRGRECYPEALASVIPKLARLQSRRGASVIPKGEGQARLQSRRGASVIPKARGMVHKARVSSRRWGHKYPRTASVIPKPLPLASPQVLAADLGSEPCRLRLTRRRGRRVETRMLEPIRDRGNPQAYSLARA